MRLDIENLDVTLGGNPVLRDVGAALPSGGMIGLIGPNGAGKSTLIRVLAGLLAPQSGTVRLEGRELRTFNKREIARQIAYLPQGHTVHWPLRADHVVSLGRLPHQTQLSSFTPRDAAAVTEAMTKAGVVPFADRLVSTLSGGERARIMLARALAADATVLLTDEPVASLDPYHQLHVMELLREQAKGGKLVVAVLHDLTLASRFCDSLILLHEGRIVAQGKAADVLSRANLEQVYGVSGVYGAQDGEAFVLAWDRLADGARIAHA